MADNRKLAAGLRNLPASARQDLAQREEDIQRGKTVELLRRAGKEMYENPIINATLSALPVSGELMAAGDIGDELSAGNYGTAGLYTILATLPGGSKGIKALKQFNTLADVVDPIEKSGVILDVYESSKKPMMTLSRIEVPKEMRGQGVGSQAMQDLVDYANQTGKTMALSPSKDFGATSVDRLKDFYKQFGFVENKGRNKDFSISESMYRLPEAE